MDAFLKENGLEEYISAFSEARITIDQLDELTENHLEKMMRLGDMLRFMKAVRKRRINEQNQPETQLKRVRKSRSRENSAHSSDGAVRQTKNVRKTKPKNDPAKKLMIIKILREDEDLREKLRQSVSAIISGFSPSLSSRDRELINLEEGTVNCPFCELGFKPQIRQDSKTFAWNVYNLSRHLGEFHSEKKGQVVESTNGDDNDSYFDPKEMLQVIYGDQVDENSMGEHSLDSASNSIETSSASNDEVQPLVVAPDVAERSEGSTSSSHVQVEEKEEPMDEPMVLEPNATEENRLSESAATNVCNRKPVIDTMSGDQVDENSMGEHSLDSASNSIETSSASNDEVQPLVVAPDVAERSEGSTSSSHVQVEEKEEPMDEPMVLEPNATEENRLSESAATNVCNRKPVIDTMSGDQVDENSMGEHSLDSASNSIETSSASNDEVQPLFVAPDVAERSEGSTSSSHVQVEEKEEPMDEPMVLEPNATEENRLSESAATNVGNRKPVIDTMSDETVTPDVAERSEGSTSSSHVQVEEKEEPIDEPVIDTMSDDVQPLMKKQLSSNEIVPEWKDEGSMFGWVKFSKRERWYAGFKYADGRAQYIKTNGYLSKHIEIVPSQGEFCDDIQSSKKKKSLTALKKFNEINFSNKSQYLK